MPRRNALMICALTACSSRNSAPVVNEHRIPVVSVQRDAGAPDSFSEPAIKVAAFDCERQESFPGEAPQHGLVAPGAGIRGWHAGGPLGANWNVDDLCCRVRVATTCTRGQIDVTLKVGRSRVAERQLKIERSPIDVEIVVPFKRWKGSFDEKKKSAKGWAPFDTAVFRALAELTCTEPYTASNSDSNYADVTDEDMFVAGFAYGE